jgi:hypothetical protein
MSKTSQWFTLTYEVVKRIMRDIEQDEPYMLRLLFTYIADENFISNFLTKVGVPGRRRCGVRFIEWNDQTGKKIQRSHIRSMLSGPWLFARKMYNDNWVWNLFLKEVKKFGANGKLPDFLRYGCNDPWVERPRAYD